MPILEIGLVAATTSYLVPLIISCGGAVIVAIGTFIAGFKLARRKNKTDLSGLKKQQYERDKQTKQEAERAVMQTDQDVRSILTQSKRQQTQLDQTIFAFQEEIDTSREITEDLEEVTYEIREIAETGQRNLTDMCTELERLNKELVRVTEALKVSEQSLNEKEALLKRTLDKLAACEQQASNDTLISVEHIQKLRTEISHIHVEFDTFRKTKLLQKEQMESLQEQNQRLTSTIDRLEKTVLGLNDSLENATANNESQFQEIQRLIHENKRLVQLIEELSQVIESEPIETKNESYQTSKTSMRLFN